MQLRSNRILVFSTFGRNEGANFYRGHDLSVAISPGLSAFAIRVTAGDKAEHRPLKTVVFDPTQLSLETGLQTPRSPKPLHATPLIPKRCERYDDAVDCLMKAILLDPDFKLPYQGLPERVPQGYHEGTRRVTRGVAFGILLGFLKGLRVLD